MACATPSTCDCICTKVIVDPSGTPITIYCDVFTDHFTDCRCNLTGTDGSGTTVTLWAADTGILFCSLVTGGVTYTGICEGSVCDSNSRFTCGGNITCTASTGATKTVEIDGGSCAVPASCPTLTADYEIDGYVAGDLDGCAGCYDDSNAPWDGLYKHTNGCTWIIDYGGSYSSVSDKLLGTTSQIRFVASTKWTVNVVCYGAAGNITIWDGEKTIGDTPEGVYTRTSGCDVTSSLSIVEA